ncbi:hypothetical protein KR074_004977 [Drosophila pseudoananassae]|nr:hypothetical protein KR074_004977 [Drosophila pseudoananassae]
MSGQVCVLQCNQCQMYQGSLVRKAKKWDCKICGQKQDLITEIFRGSGPECRAKVQHLNLERGKREEQRKNTLVHTAQVHSNRIPDEDTTERENIPQEKKPSKWASYVDEPLETKPRGSTFTQKDQDEDMDLDNGQSSMNFVKSQRKASRSLKRSAESEPLAVKRSSKWDDFV